jgi:PAS domain S-box-containing protein
MLNGDDTADAETSAQEVRRALREEGTWQGDSISRRKDGTRFWTNSTISSHTLPEQEPMWIAVVRDTTQRRALEDELKHSKEQLELAMRGSSSGMWSVDMLGGDMVCDARVFEIFGLDPQRGAMTRERWVGAIHPDDLEYAVAVFRQHLKGETPIFQIEHRIRHTDGHWVWVLASGKVMERTENGWATRIIGTCQDVSAQKRLTQETENLMIRLESFLKSALRRHVRGSAEGSEHNEAREGEASEARSSARHHPDAGHPRPSDLRCHPRRPRPRAHRRQRL